MSHAVVLISCPDQKGITAAVTDFVFKREGNIIHAAQHTDEQAGLFFMRIEWEMEGFRVHKEGIAAEFSSLAQHYGMDWQLHFTDEKVRTAIFVSKHLHCLYDLLFRYKAGQLPHGDIVLIVSNHIEAETFARQWGIEFVHVPVNSVSKAVAEKVQLDLLAARGISLSVLARYHQVLSADFVRHHENRIINIHHSFLPAFVGAGPYAQAYQKGVKIIGATAHYVTPDLDQGPIIEQDTARIDHTYSVQDMIEVGQDLERMVLYRAVRWHLERRILCCRNKTIVFD